MRVGSRMPSDVVVVSHGRQELLLLSMLLLLLVLFTEGIKYGIMPADSRAGTDLGSLEEVYGRRGREDGSMDGWKVGI